MTDIKKKIYPQFFNLIASGNKNYELRLADFECEPGNTLVLQEWDPEKQEYTGRELKKIVTYVGRVDLDDLHWTKEEIEEKGLQIISFKPE